MANVVRLGRGATKKVNQAIDDLFDKSKVRFLGPQSVIGKRIYITYDRTLSLPGVFEAGSYEEAVKPDLDVLNSLLEVAASYMDAYRERTKARVIHEINGALAEAKHLGGMSQGDFRNMVNVKLADVWADVYNQVHTLVDTEVSHAKNVSVLDGIIGANLNAGVNDPVVYFVVVRDNLLCDECKRLHLMEDGVTPRLYKLSELGHGYHKKGQDNPKIGGLHPHCRCTLVTLLPNYGFTKDGMIKYVKRGHDEFSAQRELERSQKEIGEILAKTMDPEEVKIGEPLEKMAVIYDNPQEPMIVWRVENELGWGPYVWDSGYIDKLRETNPTEADALLERGHTARRIMSQIPAEITPDPIHDFSLDSYNAIGDVHRFGFKTPQDLEHWFDESLPQLAALGYYMKPVKASKVWAAKDEGPYRSDEPTGQVFYLPHDDAPTMIKPLQAKDLDEPSVQKSEEESRTFYHVTPTKYLPDILKDGLKPIMGKNSEEASESVPRVFMFPSLDQAHDAISNWLGDSLGDEPLSILKIQLPKGHPITEEPGSFEVHTGKAIHPNYISVEQADNLTKAIPELPLGQKKYEMNFPRGGGVARYDYSHLLTPLQRARGYELSVEHRHHPGAGEYDSHDVGVYLHYNKQPISVGNVSGFFNVHRPSKWTSEMEPHAQSLEEKHRNLGFGKAMYMALYAHAKHHGVKYVSGKLHTASAHRVHESLARAYGLGYNPRSYAPGTVEHKEGREIRPLDVLPNEPVYGPYHYALNEDDWNQDSGK